MKNILASLLLAALSTSSHADRFAEKLELAKQGDPSAQWFVGISYQYGIGVPENDETGIMWYTKAAEQGDAYAQNNLGLMYKRGEGGQWDSKTSVIRRPLCNG